MRKGIITSLQEGGFHFHQRIQFLICFPYAMISKLRFSICAELVTSCEANAMTTTFGSLYTFGRLDVEGGNFQLM